MLLKISFKHVEITYRYLNFQKMFSGVLFEEIFFEN